MADNSTENILVIGPSWVGDMVMAQSLFISLKQRWSDCRITVMAPDWTRSLLERMPQVEKSLDSVLGHKQLQLGTRRAIGKSLRSENFTRAIVLPNSFKSALIPFHGNIPIRTGWSGEWRLPLLNDCRKLNKDNFPLMVQRFAALAWDDADIPPAEIPEPSLNVNEDQVSRTLRQFQLVKQAKILAICPGAEFGNAKQWPPVYYAALSNALIASGWQVWIFGSINDELAAEGILADMDEDKLPNCHNLIGRTSLAQAIDLMSAATAVVSNDSGLMHIAAALHKPVVGIYGSTSPDFTPPLAEKVKLLATDIECRPCFKRQCPYGHLRCLKDIDYPQAVAAVKELTKD